MDVVRGFFDYSISEECIAQGNYELTIKKLYELGYRTIAINQVLDEANVEPKKKKKKGEPRDVGEVVPAPIVCKPVKGCEDMRILSRLTIVYANQDVMYKITKSPLYKKYNLLALLPTTQQALQFACSNLDADILTFDPLNRSAYRCTRKVYNLLIEKGYHFEIMYGPAIQDSTQRKNIINVSHVYHTFGKSKNIIMSSGATKHFLIRGPYDVINLGFIFGLNEQQSKSAITNCCRNVYVNSVGRRCGKVAMLVENIQEPVKETLMDIDDDDDENDEEKMNEHQPAQKKIKSLE